MLAVKILLILNSLLSFSEVLNVLDTSYEVPEVFPSCQILKYREQERDKMIRELIHLEKIDHDSETARLMKLNYLQTNKEFLDFDLWNDEVVDVKHTFEISKTLREKMETMSLDQVLFLIEDYGFYWKGIKMNFPQDVVFEEVQPDKMTLTYQIYLSSFCQKGEQLPLIEVLEQ